MTAQFPGLVYVWEIITSLAPDQALDAGLQWGRPHQVWQRSYYIISQLKTGHLKSGFREKLICSQAIFHIWTSK